MSNAGFTDSISDMESEFHYEYASQRLDKNGCVYVEHPVLIRELDDFCDIDKMHQKQGPLILFGESGSGKSSLLSNWITRRKKHVQTWCTNALELVFYHAVGCTRNSTYVSTLLDRLLSEIKYFFELPKDIPTIEERLRWQFPRFLEAASRKGRVIIIIDGLHRLRTSDGEGILRWLPLSFPPNVRMIFTGTLPDENMVSVATDGEIVVKDGKVETLIPKSIIDRVQIEATRRQWKTLCFEDFPIRDRTRLINRFLNRLEQNTTSNDVLILLPIQQEALAKINQSANPMFLHMLLKGLVWAINGGVDIHSALEQFITTESVAALYEAILRLIEHGFTPSSSITSRALSFLDDQKEQIEQLASLAKLRRKDSQMALEAEVEDEDEQQREEDDEDRIDEENLEEDRKKFEFEEEEEARDTDLDAKSVESEVYSDFEEENESLEKAQQAATEEDGNFEPDDNVSSDRESNPASEEAKLHPIWLRGGKAVAPLHPLLGRSLALLYTSRHGLHENELRTILNQLMVEEALDLQQENPQGDLLSSPKAKKAIIDNHKWERLRVALECLGVICHRRIWVLPSCADNLREIIWWRFIATKKEERKCHKLLVRFFMQQPTSFRKAEELPWHLKFGLQWSRLKDVLIDVPMFRLLFTSVFKAELFGYWQILTEQTSNDQDGTEQRSSFDIVREYAKGVDHWNIDSHRTSAELTALLNLISQFIYEYSFVAPKSHPEFIHPSIDPEALDVAGIILPDQPTCQLSNETTSLYLFKRWQWIHFPWIALTNPLAHRANEGLKKTLGAIQNRDKAVSLRKNSSFATSWEQRKKQFAGQKGGVKESQLRGIINAHCNVPSNVSLTSLIGPSSSVNKKLRRNSTVFALRQTVSSVSSVQKERDRAPIKALPRPDQSGKKSSKKKLHSTMEKWDKANVVQHTQNVRVTAEKGGGNNPEMGTDWEIKRGLNQELLYRLKSVFNDVSSEKAEKTKKLAQMKQKYKELRKTNQAVMKQVEDGETAMKAMQMRTESIVEAMEKIEQQGVLSGRIIKVCTDYPVAEKLYISQQKKSVQLLRLKLVDLERNYEARRYGNQHILKTELPTLRQEYEKSKKLYVKVIENVVGTKDRMMKDKAANESLFRHRQSIVKQVKLNTKDLTKEEEVQLLKKVDAHDQEKEDIESESMIVKNALQQCDLLCNKIKNATGLSNLEVIYQKFITRGDLSKNLEDQVAQYELKLQRMKHTYRDIEKELTALQYDSATSKSDDIRELDHTLRETEMRKTQAENDQLAIDTHMKESLMGLAHIAKLLGFTRLDQPRNNVIPSQELWPPRQSKNLAADLTRASPEDVSRILNLCEERATAILDLVEHGRGNPDHGFHPDASGKGKKRVNNLSLRMIEEENSPKVTARSKVHLNIPESGGQDIEEDEEEVFTRLTIKTTSKKQVNMQKRRSMMAQAATLIEQENEED